MRYALACEECGTNITLKQHIDPYMKYSNLKPQTFFKQSDEFAWIVTNDAVFQIDGSGKFTKTILQLTPGEYNCSAAVASI